MQDIESASDEDIVEQVRSRDREQYAVIMARYQDKLLRYATALVLDADAAADIVQESFIKAFVNLRSFNTKRKFSSWMYRIVHNEAMNAVKKYRHETAVPEGFDVPSDENPAHDLERQEIVARVRKCIGRLPVRYAEPVALFYLEDQPYDAISDILRIPMGTVATRIRRAKEYMKTLCRTL